MSGKSHSHTWLIDSGASHHMSGRRALFCDMVPITSRFIRLPNGETTFATHEGTVPLQGSLTLTRVLFVPHLTCNLISVGCLIDDLKCTVQFDDRFCVIQDRVSIVQIGKGRRFGGVYCFDEGSFLPPISSFCARLQGDRSLWH